MAAFEKVMQMKQRGFSDDEIIQTLRQEGISPKEINDSLSQSNIKNNVDFDQEYPNIDRPVREMAMQQNPMIESIMFKDRPVQQDSANQQQYPPNGQQYPANVDYQDYAQEQNPMENIPYPEAEMAQEQQNIPQEYQEYYPEYQQGYQEYQPQQSVNIETINEIAEQIAEEKSEKIKKEMSSFTKFKETIDFEISKLNERTQKMENSFNELQIAILRKIGSYGEDIKNISREMHATQDSFSKILDPLADNIKELQKITGKTEKIEMPKSEKQEPVKKNQKKSKMDFEDYLR